MTIGSENWKVQYDGDGSQTSFSVTFQYAAKDDVVVIHTDADGNDTTWVRGTQYTLTGPGVNGTLTVVTSPIDFTPASGERLTIYRDVGLTQNHYDKDHGTALSGPEIEASFDHLTFIAHRMQEQINRGVLRKQNTETSGPLDLPEPEAGGFLVWNTDADALENKQPADVPADASFPASSTDNVIVRFDGTSGISLQNSGVIIDDSDNVSGVGNFSLSGSIELGHASDTTLSRDSAGVLAVEGVQIGRVGEITTLSALKALDAGAYNVVYLHGYSSVGDGGEGWFVWDGSDLSNDQQSGTDGSVTAGDDQFSAASASFSSGVDERDGTNPKVLEVEGAAHASGLTRNTIFRVDSTTEVEISVDDFGTTGSSLSWTLNDADSPMYWDGGSVKGVYIPPDSDPTGASGAWVRADGLNDKSYVRPEWFYDSGDGDDYGPAFQRALDFLARHGYSDVGDEEVANGLKLNAGLVYPVETSVSVHPSLEHLAIYADHNANAVITTSTAGLIIFDVGDDVSGGADAIYALPIISFNLENIHFKNTNDASTKSNPTIALRIFQCLRTYINYNRFDDFNISIDAYRCKLFGFSHNQFTGANRASGSTAASSFVRLQGVHNSAVSGQTGGGNHVTDNEMNGIAGDLEAVENGWLIHTVDGHYMRGNHYNHLKDSVRLQPENNNYNNVISTVLCTQDYFDGKANNGRGIHLTGTVGENTGAIERIWADQCVFRTGLDGFRVAVSEDASGSGFTGSINSIKVTNGDVKSTRNVGIDIRGENNNFVSPDDVTVNGMTFDNNNAAGGSISDIFIEAISVDISHNQFKAANSAPDTAINVVLDQAGSEDRSFVIANNNFRASNYTVKPWRLSTNNLASLVIEGNLLPGRGETIRQVYDTETTDDQVSILFSRRIASASCLARLTGWVSGYSDAGTSGTRRHASHTLEFAAYTEPDGTVQVTHGEGAQTEKSMNITNNDLGTAVIRLTGSAWSSGASVSVGDTFLDSGNVWVVVEAGSGTTGTSDPLTGNSGPGSVTDSNGVRYAFVNDGEQENEIAVIVSGGGAADFKWHGFINWCVFEEAVT